MCCPVGPVTSLLLRSLPTATPLLQEAADYDYPRDSEYVPYDEQWGPYEPQEPQQWSSST